MGGVRRSVARLWGRFQGRRGKAPADGENTKVQRRSPATPALRETGRALSSPATPHNGTCPHIYIDTWVGGLLWRVLGRHRPGAEGASTPGSADATTSLPESCLRPWVRQRCESIVCKLHGRDGLDVEGCREHCSTDAIWRFGLVCLNARHAGDAGRIGCVGIPLGEALDAQLWGWRNATEELGDMGRVRQNQRRRPSISGFKLERWRPLERDSETQSGRTATITRLARDPTSEVHDARVIMNTFVQPPGSLVRARHTGFCSCKDGREEPRRKTQNMWLHAPALGGVAAAYFSVFAAQTRSEGPQRRAPRFVGSSVAYAPNCLRRACRSDRRRTPGESRALGQQPPSVAHSPILFGNA